MRRGQTESLGKNWRRLGVFVGNFIRLKIGKSFSFDIMKLNYPNSSKKQIIKEWIDVSNGELYLDEVRRKTQISLIKRKKFSDY